ncbi:MAG TPA: DUF305 domain-containing protein [Acidisarcina sp.]
MKSLRPVASAVLLVFAISPGMQSHAVHARSLNSSQDPAWSELMDGMSAMHLAMGNIQPSGDRDVDFVSLMVPHHQAALDMARTELRYGKDSQMRRLAQEIVADQQSEIELMQLWRRKHKAGTAETPAPHKGDFK